MRRPCLAFTTHPLRPVPLLLAHHRRPEEEHILLTSRAVAVGASYLKEMPQIRGEFNKNETEGGDHKAVSRQKKPKAMALKWRSSNKDMNNKVEGGGVSDDTVLSSLTTASFHSPICRKRVSNLGKVARQCDAIDPPVPRGLRSAINKRSRHVKKRRRLSAISAQISFVDRQTRSFEASQLLTDEEEVADALLSLSQTPSACEFTADRVIADNTNTNVSSASYSEGATKVGDRITMVPNADKLCNNQAACFVGHTESVPRVNPAPGAPSQPDNINRPLLENAQTKKDLSLGVVANLASSCKDSSHNSAPKVQLDGSKNYQAQKPEAPLCLVNCSKSVNTMRENGKGKNGSAQEMAPPLPCTPDGYLIKPSSCKLAVGANTVSVLSKLVTTAPGSLGKVGNGVPAKTWKRSVTHVHVSHLIQVHLDKKGEGGGKTGTHPPPQCVWTAPGPAKDGRRWRRPKPAAHLDGATGSVSASSDGATGPDAAVPVPAQQQQQRKSGSCSDASSGHL